MNNKTRFLTQILSTVAFMIVPSASYGQDAPQSGPPPADSQASSEETAVKLPTFDVTGSPVDRYNASEASSAARTASELLDTPISVYVITPAVMEDLNPGMLWDVASYYPGMSPGRVTGAIYDRMTFRGFEAYGGTVDNFSLLDLPQMAGGQAFIPEFVDHVELVMGPDSILAPTGTAGGNLASTTKSPQFTRSIDVSMEVGNYDGNKFSVDATGPLGDGKHMAYRLISFYQDSQTYVPGVIRAWAQGAEFTYKFSDTAKFMIKYFGWQDYVGGEFSNPVGSGLAVYEPNTTAGAIISTTPEPGYQYDGWNGAPTWNHHVIRDNVIEGEFTTALGDRVNMRLAGQVYYDDWNVQQASPAPSIAETYNQSTGQQIAVTPSAAFNLAAIPLTGAIIKQVSRQIQIQNDFAGKFNVGGVTLQPNVGWAYQQGTLPTQYDIQDKGLAPANLLAGGVYSTPIPSYSNFTIVGYNYPETGWTMQLYAYLRAGFFNDHLFVSAGASRLWANVNDYYVPFLYRNGIAAGAPGPVVDETFANTDNPLSPSVQPWHDTYLAGVLYKVMPNVSIYYDYSTNACLAEEVPLWQAGVQNEFGVKSTFFKGRIQLAADHFEITQSNVSFSNPLFALGQASVQEIYEDLHTRGEEVSVTGGVTKDLSVVLSYTNQQNRDDWNRRQRNIPDVMATALLDYRFGAFDTGGAKNWDVFIGAIHEGTFPGELVSGFTSLGVPEQVGFYDPAYTVFNGGAGYQWGRYKFNLNVNNIFNTRALWEATGRADQQAYPGTTVTLTVKVHIL